MLFIPHFDGDKNRYTQRRRWLFFKSLAGSFYFSLNRTRTFPFCLRARVATITIPMNTNMNMIKVNCVFAWSTKVKSTSNWSSMNSNIADSMPILLKEELFRAWSFQTGPANVRSVVHLASPLANNDPLSLLHLQNPIQTVWQMWKMALFTSG